MKKIILITAFNIIFLQLSLLYSQYNINNNLVIQAKVDQRKDRLLKNIDSFYILNKLLPFTKNQNYTLKDIKGIKIIPNLSFDVNCLVSYECNGSHPEILSCLVDSFDIHNYDYYVVNLNNKEYGMYNKTINNESVTIDFNEATFIKVKKTFKSKKSMASINGNIVTFHKNEIFLEGGFTEKFKFKLDKRSIQMTLFYGYGILPCGKF